MARDRWLVYVCPDEACRELGLFPGLCDNLRAHPGVSPAMVSILVEQIRSQDRHEKA